MNAGGPWVEGVIRDGFGGASAARVRLVRGSHIVTRKLFEHDRAYIFQQEDGRIVFAIPYEGDFTLIGTTDVEHEGPPGDPVCTEAERDYLLGAVAGYFRAPPTAADIVWSYSGVRPLYDDGASSATAATRDYVISLRGDGAPAVDVFGGKITTYRRLAEAALARLAPSFPGMGPAWTARVPLPGGDFPVGAAPRLAAELRATLPLPRRAWAARLVRSYGTEAATLLAGARTADDLGERFGWDLTAREVDWLIEREWARTAEDVLWRRSKLGLRLTRRRGGPARRLDREPARRAVGRGGSGRRPRARVRAAETRRAAGCASCALGQVIDFVWSKKIVDGVDCFGSTVVSAATAILRNGAFVR